MKINQILLALAIIIYSHEMEGKNKRKFIFSKNTSRSSGVNPWFFTENLKFFELKIAELCLTVKRKLISLP